MKIQLERNDNCYTVSYYPDTHEIELDSIEGNDYDNLFVAEGTFPNVKYVPLAQALLREAERQYVDDLPYANEYADERLNKEQLGLK